MTVHHQFAEIQGHQLFYREAGPADAPTVVLLHGYPTSSHMFRDLVPLLAQVFHVLAPDHLGFGLSDAPGVGEEAYTFDRLAELTAGLLAHLGIDRYAIYVQDYGAPIGWRLALADPSPVTAIITQSGNAYDDGFVPDFWASVWAWAAVQNPDTERAIRGALTLDAIRWQYLHGVADPTLVSPETWEHDHVHVSRPGNDAIQLALFADYATNPPRYPALQQHLRDSSVPVLAVWGEGDEIFGPEGARAFARDAADPEIHLLDGGHFLLETHLDEVAALITDFLTRRLPETRALTS